MDDKDMQYSRRDFKLEIHINLSEVVGLIGIFGSLWLWLGWI